MQHGSRLILALLLVLVFACLGGRAAAQGHPGGGGPPGGGMPGGGQMGGQNPWGGPMNAPRGIGGGVDSGPPPNGAASTTSTMRGGLQLGPPGRWWDDAQLARSVGLDRIQQHRMDDVFKVNKTPLIRSYKALQHEESVLEKLSRSKNPDEIQIDQQIDRVVQARGELEKANAHLLLEIRKEMTQDQLDRLEEHRPAMSYANEN